MTLLVKGGEVLAADQKYPAAVFCMDGLIVCAPSSRMADGRIVWHTGQLRAVRGAGRYIKQPCFPPVSEAAALLKT